MRVGFIGLGRMGYGMGCSIVREGFDLYVFNRTAEKAERFVGECGGRALKTPREVGEVSDVIHIMVSDNEAVGHMIWGKDGLIETLTPGKVVVVSSTITPQFSMLVQSFVGNKGARYVEAPVLGSVSEAREGKLITYVGGLEEDAELSTVKAFSRQVFYVGEVPKASALKLAINNLFLTIIPALATSLGLAKGWGIGEEEFIRYVESTWMKVIIDRYKERALNEQFPTRFPIYLAAKDLKYVSEALRGVNLPAIMPDAAANLYLEATLHGMGSKDYSNLLAFMRWLIESGGRRER